MNDRDIGTCRKCGAQVWWVRMERTGRMNPLEPVSSPGAPFVVWWEGDEYVGRWAPGGPDRYRSHMETCTARQHADQPPRSQGGVRKTPHAVLYVTEDAPAAVVQAAYRALARIHHPDVGGDAEAMKTINAAYERIMSGR